MVDCWFIYFQIEIIRLVYNLPFANLDELKVELFFFLQVDLKKLKRDIDDLHQDKTLTEEVNFTLGGGGEV